MAVAWPTGVSQEAAASGTQGGPQDNAASFQPDIGPSIDRQRTTIAPEIIDCTLKPMEPAEYAIFRAWVKDDLKNGVLAFDWIHPITKAATEFRMVRQNPLFSWSVIGGELISISFRVIEVPQ